MLLQKLLTGLENQIISGSIDIDISGIAYDSRKVKKGFVFVCVEGYKVDGHSYIDSAIQNGASAIIVQKNINAKQCVSVIKVDDTRLALSHISNLYFDNPSKKFNLIGVTGTKGKTTITYMIKSILEARGQKTGLIGTISNKIGEEVLPAERTTPESYDLQELFSYMNKFGADSVVMEVSSHALELHRVSKSDFDIGIFSNLTQDHLDFHKNFENYFNAKAKLFKMCKKGIVNIDSSYGEQMLKKAVGCEVVTYGIEKDADIKAYDIKKSSEGVHFKLRSKWGNHDINVNIPGEFSVYNALAAIGAACLMNIPFEDIKKGLEMVNVPGRAEIIEIDKDFTVMIDYAHSPDSLKNILEAVKEYAPGRVVCLFGCGGDRDRAKRPIMGEISGKMADYTIITSDNPRTEKPEEIIDEIEVGIKKTNAAYIKIVDRKEAIKHAIMNAKPKDIIVLAGKGHETYQIFDDKSVHFDEREIIREILNS